MTPWYWFLILCNWMRPARRGRKKKCYFTFLKPGEPLHLCQLLQDCHPGFLTQLKFPLPKLEVVQERPAPSLVTDTLSCICHMLLLSLVLFPSLLTMAASKIHGQTHKPAARFMFYVVKITNKPDFACFWLQWALVDPSVKCGSTSARNWLGLHRIFLKLVFILNTNV